MPRPWRDEHYRREELAVYQFRDEAGSYTGMAGNTTFEAEERLALQLQQGQGRTDPWRVELPAYLVSMDDWTQLFLCLQTFDVLLEQTRALVSIGAKMVLTSIRWESGKGMRFQSTGIEEWTDDDSMANLMAELQPSGKALVGVTSLVASLSGIANSPPAIAANLLPRGRSRSDRLRVLIGLVIQDQLRQTVEGTPSRHGWAPLVESNEEVPLPSSIRSRNSSLGMQLEYVWHFAEAVRCWHKWEQQREEEDRKYQERGGGKNT